MSALNQSTVTLAGAGGTAPYAFAIVAGSQTTIPATLSGLQLTVDATGLSAGTYSVLLQITDATLAVVTKLLTVDVLPQNVLAVVNRDLTYQPGLLPLTPVVPLIAAGATGAVTWSLLPGVTTAPNATITGSNLSFALTAYGTWTVGVRATDSLNNTAVRLLTVTVAATTVVSMVDGHARIEIDAQSQAVGVHNFTLGITDAASALKRTTFTYTVAPTISNIEVPRTAIDHYWGTGDTTTLVYPITGDLAGFSVGTVPTITASNGLTASIDTTTNSLVISGPPTSFGNSEIEVVIAIAQGSTQVATVTREFTLVSHNGTTALGAMTCTTRPYIVGEVVGLNPQRPYFNSPNISKGSGVVVQVATGSTLPLGLSLDSVTGLIYGTVTAADVTQSALNYVDTAGTILGAVTVVWDILVSAFQLTSSLTDGALQVAYNGTIGSSSSARLALASVHRGTLPTGLSLSISSDGHSVVLNGTPTQAGFFDLWLQVTNTNGQLAYLYKRLAIEYATPLAIVTTYLQPMQTGATYTQTLAAVGGTQPYTWHLQSGTLPAGVTLNAASGVLSGTPSASSYSQQLTFLVTDSRGVSASATLSLTINNTLAITTTVIPIVTPGANYAYQINAIGGQGSYTWVLASGSAALPSGISLSSGGLLSGATSTPSFSATVSIKVTDSIGNTATANFTVSTGMVTGLLIDTEGIGPIVRGASYQGTLAALGTGVAPYSWSVTSDSPNTLPAGLALTGNYTNRGATASISGSTTAVLLNYSVKIQVVDANGNSAFAFLLLNTYSGLVITTASLPQATATGSYSTQLTCSGVNPAFTWSLDSTSPTLPSGLTFSSSGVLSGVASSASSVTLVFRVTDALGDYTTKALGLMVVLSGLTVVTSSLPQVTAGVGYSTSLQASGGTAPYTWSISPSSASVLPVGLSLNASNGAISGSTVLAGTTSSITFRVTDAINVYHEATLNLSVLAGLTLLTGPDYLMNTSINSLGLVADGDISGIVENNMSFIVAAKNCISTTAAGFSFGLPSGYGATCISISGGVALFKLSGPFGSSPAGVNNFNFSVSDSGVNVSKTFQYTVFNQMAVSLSPLSVGFPSLFS